MRNRPATLAVTIATLAIAMAILSPPPGNAQVNQQNLPANTVVGRTAIGAGPAQAIPFSQLGLLLGVGIFSTPPTISAGFCTSPSIPNANGTAAFTINVGSACAGSTGTLAMPTAPTGWVCDFHDVTTPASNIVEQTGGATNTVTLTNYVRTTGVAGNFTSSDVIRAKCVSY